MKQQISIERTKGQISKIKMSSLSALLVLGLAAGPAKASHYGDVIVPLATVATLAYLFDSHHNHYSYKRKYRSSHGYRHGYRHGHHQKHRRYSHRKHSYSSGGYSHRTQKHRRH